MNLRLQLLLTKSSGSFDFLSPRIKSLLLFFILGLGLRLGGLHQPSAVVFDETYFGRFSSAYCCTGEDFFDIHPPHTKILIGGTAWLLGYRGGFAEKKINEVFEPESIALLRVFPSLMSSLIVPLGMLILWQLGASFQTGIFFASILTLENAILLHTRLISLDGFLIGMLLLCLWSSLKSTANPSLRACFWYVIAGFAAAFSIGSKFSGMVCLIFPAVVEFFRAESWRSFLKRAPVVYVIFLCTGLVAYLSGWWLHFSLLDFDPPLQQFYTPKGDFFRDTLELHRIMLSANMGITTSHPNASTWWMWLGMMKPIFYWSHGDTRIYLFGNMWIWWTVVLGYACALLHTFFLLLKERSLAEIKSHRSFLILFVIILGCYLPLVPVKRPLFLYHFFPTLVFIMMATSLWLEKIQWIKMGSLKNQRLSLWLYLILGILVFAWTLPMGFGWELGALSLYRIFPGMF